MNSTFARLAVASLTIGLVASPQIATATPVDPGLSDVAPRLAGQLVFDGGDGRYGGAVAGADGAVSLPRGVNSGLATALDAASAVTIPEIGQRGPVAFGDEGCLAVTSGHRGGTIEPCDTSSARQAYTPVRTRDGGITLDFWNVERASVGYDADERGLRPVLADETERATTIRLVDTFVPTTDGPRFPGAETAQPLLDIRGLQRARTEFAVWGAAEPGSRLTATAGGEVVSSTTTPASDVIETGALAVPFDLGGSTIEVTVAAPTGTTRTVDVELPVAPARPADRPVVEPGIGLDLTTAVTYGFESDSADTPEVDSLVTGRATPGTLVTVTGHDGAVLSEARADETGWYTGVVSARGLGVWSLGIGGDRADRRVETFALYPLAS